MADGDSSTATADWVVPDHVPEQLVIELDHWHGRDYLADPLGFWDPLRDEYPVFWSPLHGGFWCLTRYESIHEAFQHPEIFSSKITNIPGREIRMLPITLDPPEHTKYRRLLNEPFGPARMELLAPHIREICVQLVDDVDERGDCEFVGEFAQSLPVSIFCELLGLPREEVPQFLDWNYVILHNAGGVTAQQTANQELQAYLEVVTEARKKDPGHDLISMLIGIEMEGEKLTDDEVMGFAYLLFLAGLDTVTSALGWSWKHFAEHPEHRRQIVDDPSLIPGAVEELLRFYAFVEDSRTLTQDYDFLGVTMREGDRIMLPTSAACRDERQFPNAMTVDFRREPNRHLAFASGAHRCLGSHLARTELRIAMQEWHARLPNYRIPEGADVHAHGGAVIGLDVLPLEIIKD